MGRPRKDDTLTITYFPHPVTLRTCNEMEYMLNPDVIGVEAYYVLCSMLEDAAPSLGILRVAPGIPHTARSYAARLNVGENLVQNCWNVMQKLNIIVVKNESIEFIDVKRWFGKAISEQKNKIADRISHREKYPEKRAARQQAKVIEMAAFSMQSSAATMERMVGEMEEARGIINEERLSKEFEPFG